MPENNVSTGVRTSGIGEFESVRGNTPDLSATSSEGLVGQVTDVSGTRKERVRLVVAFTRDHRVKRFAQSVHQPGGVPNPQRWNNFNVSS